LQQRKVVFLVSSGKKQISLLLPPQKILKNLLVAPPWKNPSDALVAIFAAVLILRGDTTLIEGTPH